MWCKIKNKYSASTRRLNNSINVMKALGHHITSHDFNVLLLKTEVTDHYGVVLENSPSTAS